MSFTKKSSSNVIRSG